jgi:hypothetical protein
MMVRVVVHVRRRLTNMYVGLIGSVNDFWVLWELGLYKQTQEEGLLIWKKVIKKVSIHLFLVTTLSIVVLDNDTSQWRSTFFSWVVIQQKTQVWTFNDWKCFQHFEEKLQGNFVQNGCKYIQRSQKSMLDTSKNYIYVFVYVFVWHSKIMIIFWSCVKWLIWVLRNSN